MFGRYTTSAARIVQVERPPALAGGPRRASGDEVETHVLRNAGARPWDRDADDLRVIFDVAEGRGQIINDEERWAAIRTR